MKLQGEVIEYRAGSQAMRYIVGFGAGKTKIVAHVKLVDLKSDTVIYVSVK